jgi:hypothetical protein
LRLATPGHAFALAIVIAIAVAGCGSSTTPTAVLVPTAAVVTPSTAPSARLESGDGLTVKADPALLDFIPDTPDGLEMFYDSDTTRQVAADPALAKDAVGLAIALFTVTGAATPADDLAIVSVVRLRDPSVGEGAYRTWRDTYDASACGPAGGVAGNAQSTINGRIVYIGSCNGGVLTYHVRIREGAIVVSVTSIGPMRLGEKVMKAIGP